MARPSDSIGVRWGKSWLIWNVRDRPSRTRSFAEKAVTSRPSQKNPALGRLDHAGQEIDQRRLAGAVGADQRLPGAGRERERDVVGREQGAELPDEPARFQSRTGHAAAPRAAVSRGPRSERARTRSCSRSRPTRTRIDQQQADPELPVFGRRGGDDVAQDDEHRRADDPAVEIAGAADDQHQHHVGGAVEVEQVERHDLRRLGEQRARRAGVGRRDRIDGDDAPAGGDAERAGPQAVFADRRERQAERRLAQPARDGEQHEQDDEAVERRVALAGEIDREQPQNLADREVEAVRAAGQPAVAVGEFAEQQRHAERHHEPRQVGAAQEKRRGGEADEPPRPARPRRARASGRRSPRWRGWPPHRRRGRGTPPGRATRCRRGRG